MAVRTAQLDSPGIPLGCGGRGRPDRSGGAGILFRAEAVSASLAALALIPAPRQLTFLPFPDLYGPVWFPEKLRAAPPVIVTTDFRLGR